MVKVRNFNCRTVKANISGTSFFVILLPWLSTVSQWPGSISPFQPSCLCTLAVRWCETEHSNNVSKLWVISEKQHPLLFAGCEHPLQGYEDCELVNPAAVRRDFTLTRHSLVMHSVMLYSSSLFASNGLRFSFLRLNVNLTQSRRLLTTTSGS